MKKKAFYILFCKYELAFVFLMAINEYFIYIRELEPGNLQKRGHLLGCVVDIPGSTVSVDHILCPITVVAWNYITQCHYSLLSLCKYTLMSN